MDWSGVVIKASEAETFYAGKQVSLSQDHVVKNLTVGEVKTLFVGSAFVEVNGETRTVVYRDIDVVEGHQVYIYRGVIVGVKG